MSLLDSVSPKAALVVFGAITVVIIVLVICYIAYHVRRKDLKSVSIIKNPKRLFDMSGPFVYDASRIPATLNGQEFAYSAWLYISEFTTTTEHKLILARGSDTHGANPIMFMDNRTNKVYVSIMTNQSDTFVSSLDEVLDKNKSKYLTATIEYLPLQRWVHILFVVQDNLLTVYMDGDIYTVENVYDFNVPGRDRPVFAGSVGSVVVGKTSGSASTQGYVCKTEFFNHALTPKDVRDIYDRGPVNSNNILTKLGLPAYGLRSPIYREDEQDSNDQPLQV